MDESLEAEAGDLWSEDPKEKIVQLSRQLKVARGLVDKKSDFCDELAEQLRQLQRELEERDGILRDTRASLNTTGAELRAAAHVSSLERSENSEEISSLQSQLAEVSLRASTLDSEHRQHAARISTLQESEQLTINSKDQLLSDVTELRQELQVEIVATQTLASQESSSREELQSELGDARIRCADNAAALAVEAAELGQCEALRATLVQQAEEASMKNASLQGEVEYMQQKAEDVASLQQKLEAQLCEESSLLAATVTSEEECATSEARLQNVCREEGLREAEAWRGELKTCELRGEELQASLAERNDRLEAEVLEIRNSSLAAKDMHNQELSALEIRHASELRELKCRNEEEAARSAALAEEQLEAALKNLRAESSREASEVSVQLSLRLEEAERESAERLLLEAKEASEAQARAAAEEQLALAERLSACGSQAAADATALAAAEQRSVQLEQQLSESKKREAKLQIALQEEKELHDGALRMFYATQHEGANQADELSTELEHLSGELEEKEDEIMNIKFDMVGLQNELKDKTQAFDENSEEWRKGREMLAEKDEKLQHALKRQSELVVQMNEATSRLQEKVAQLSRDLDNSHTAYQALEQHTQVVIQRLENDRDGLKADLTQTKADLDTALARLEEVEPLAAGFAGANAEAEDARCQAAALEKEVESLQQTLAELRKDCERDTAAHEAKLAEVHAASRSLEERTAERQDEWAAEMQRAEADTATKLDVLREELQGEVAASASTNANLLEELQQALSQAEESATARTELESQVSSEALAAVSLKAREEELLERCASADERLEFLCKSVEDQSEASQSARQNLTVAEEKLARYESRAEEQMQEHAAASQKYHDHMQRTEETQEHVTANLSMELCAAQDALECMQNELKDQHLEVEELRSTGVTHQLEVEARVQESEVVDQQRRQWQEIESKMEAAANQLAKEHSESKDHIRSLEMVVKCSNVEAAEATKQVKTFEDLIADYRQREANFSERAQIETERTWSMQEKLQSMSERLHASEIRVSDLEKALDRSRLTERQAVERVQELRTSLALLREFGHEEFMQLVPGPKPAVEKENSEKPQNANEGSDGETAADPFGAEVPSVLIAVELDLGFATATLSVAPWQTRADFAAVVDAFLKEHKVRPIFAEALLLYLEEVETEATAFPVLVKASLSDVYSLHG